MGASRDSGGSGGTDGVVGLVLDHRPDDQPARAQRILEELELGQQLGRHAGFGLVAGPALVAPGADDVVGGAGEMRHARLAQQPQDALPDAAGGPHLPPALEAAGVLEAAPIAGLSPAEAARRAALTGPNELEPAKHESIVRMVVDAATEPFVVLLAVAGILAVWLTEE